MLELRKPRGGCQLVRSRSPSVIGFFCSRPKSGQAPKYQQLYGNTPFLWPFMSFGRRWSRRKRLCNSNQEIRSRLLIASDRCRSFCSIHTSDITSAGQAIRSDKFSRIPQTRISPSRFPNVSLSEESHLLPPPFASINRLAVCTCHSAATSVAQHRTALWSSLASRDLSLLLVCQETQTLRRTCCTASSLIIERDSRCQ